MSTVKIIIISISLVVLLMCVAFFTSSETAFLSLQKVKIRRMISEKKPHAKLVQKLRLNIDYLLTTVLIGTNFLNSLSSALATVLAVSLVGNGAVGIATIVISFFITVFGQIIPKTIASIKPEDVASRSAVPLYLLEKIFFPVIWLFTKISHFAVFSFEKIIKPVSNSITDEEIQTLFEVGEHEGTLEKSESLMLNRIFSVSDLLVKDIMRHRSFVRLVEQNASQKEVVDEFLDSGFSNIAVYRETIEDIVGIINYKQVLFQSQMENRSENEAGFAKSVMSPVIQVPGTMHVFEILKLFKSEKHKFAIVLDEQGGTLGVLTIKDIMKVVFGRMSDESANEDVPPENRIKAISSSELVIPGDMKIEDVNSLLNLSLESEYFSTLGGWVLEQFGVLPSRGQVMINEKILFIVEDVEDRRILSVRVRLGG